MGKVLSLKDLKQAVFEGKKEIVITVNTILTPSAKDYALTGAIKIINSSETCTEVSNDNDDLKLKISRMIETVVKEKNINLTDVKKNTIVKEVLNCICK